MSVRIDFTLHTVHIRGNTSADNVANLSEYLDQLTVFQCPDHQLITTFSSSFVCECIHYNDVPLVLHQTCKVRHCCSDTLLSTNLSSGQLHVFNSVVVNDAIWFSWRAPEDTDAGGS